MNLTAGQTLTLNVNRAPDGNLVVSSGTFDLATFTIDRSGGGGTFSMAAGTTVLVGGATNFPNNYGDQHAERDQHGQLLPAGNPDRRAT